MCKVWDSGVAGFIVGEGNTLWVFYAGVGCRAGAYVDKDRGESDGKETCYDMNMGNWFM